MTEPSGLVQRQTTDTMSPSFALFLWLTLLVGLLYFDPAKVPGTSLALWVPVIWMFIVATRLPSQWFGGQVALTTQTLEEGNSLDRSVLIVLMLLAIGILISRSFKWCDFFARNVALTAFLSFALVSVLWSDFPFVAFKRWFRDLGNYLVVLVVLSDPDPLEAVRAVLRRLCYLLIPLSVLLIKYFPEIGKQYSVWTGADMYVGPTTGKNSLGVVCLVSGIFLFWDTVVRWSDRAEHPMKRIILVNITLMVMTLWLLHLANSATSRVCLLVGCLVIAAGQSKTFQRRLTFLKILIPASLCLYLLIAFGLNMNGELAAAAWRDPTLTDRTEIWKIVSSVHTDPILGTGYESFWLGDRLKLIWQTDVGHINESHNGYLEVYLNLGIIGLFLLGGFLIVSYRTICKRLTSFSHLASLTLALWTIALLYNVTEAAFKWHFMWVTLLLSAIAVQGPTEHQVLDVSAFDSTGETERFFDICSETTDRG